MQFCWTTLHVKNMEASLAFYQGIVGLKINRKFQAGNAREIAFLGDGPTQLELICDGLESTNCAEGISMGFIIQGSLEAHIEHLKEQGYRDVSEIYAPNPMIRFVYVKDPDGFSVQFVEQI